MAHLVPGIEMDFGGGKVYTLAPLPLIELQRLQDRISELTISTATNPKSLSTIFEVLHASLKRNYPTMTFEESAALVDVGNMLDVVSNVLDVGGFKRKALEEAAQAKNQAAQLKGITPPETGPAS
jgi:hypothetical protein